MCCTQREMQAEGKKIDTTQWFRVKEVPCCIPKTPPVTNAQREERKGGMDTGIPCGRCLNNTLRLLRTVKRAEQHEGEDLGVTLVELACPCGNQTVYLASVAERLAAQNGVTIHVE